MEKDRDGYWSQSGWNIDDGWTIRPTDGKGNHTCEVDELSGCVFAAGGIVFGGNDNREGEGKLT